MAKSQTMGVPLNITKKEKTEREKNAHFYREQHVQEAKQLSAELGGTDQDVKEWFFSLENSSLMKVWSLYGRAEGAQALAYAKKTYPEWKSGQVRMSGSIASRLFKLLPPIMPTKVKYDLVESLWEHVGPKKKVLILAGSQSSSEDIVNVFVKEVKNLTTKWQIPEGMNIRFGWLSENGSKLTQELLSHIRKQEKELGERVIELHVPILKEKFSGELKETISRLSHFVELGNQTVELRLQGKGSAIKVSDLSPKVSDLSPKVSDLSPASSSSRDSSGVPPWVWLGGLLILVIVIMSQK